MKQLLNIILMLVVGWSLHAERIYRFTQYTSQDGLHEKAVQSIMQDRQGLMWLGTWSGLYSYDGDRFTRRERGANGFYPINDRMEQLQEDPWGGIWMMSYVGIVYRYDPQQQNFSQMTPDDLQVSTLRVMTDGVVWAVTEQEELYLLRRSGEGGEWNCVDLFEEQQFSRPSRINDIALDDQDRHWLLTEGGCYCYLPSTGELRTVCPDDAYGLIVKDNTYYIGTRKGRLLAFDPQLNLREEHQLPTTASLKQLVLLPDQSMAIMTGQDGFFVLTPQLEARHVTISTCPALGTDRMQEMRADGCGELWIRTSQPGVVHYVPRTGVARHFILHDVYGNPIDAALTNLVMAEDASHQLWIRPAGGGLGRYDRERDELIPFFNPSLQNHWSNSNNLMAMLCDRQGNVWIDSYDNGLEKASPNLFPFEVESFDREHLDFAGNSVRGIFQDREGYIWASGKDRVIRLFTADLHWIGNLCADGSVSRERSDQLGLGYSYAQTSEGWIWIGTKGDGLIRLEPLMQGTSQGASRGASQGGMQGGLPRYRLTRYQSSDNDIWSLSGDNIYSLWVDLHDRLWIATFKHGLNVMVREGEEGRTVRFVNSRNQLTAYPMVSFSSSRYVTGDADGNIWIATTGGIVRTRGNLQSLASLRFSRYRHQEGDSASLPVNDVMHLLTTRSGRHFACTFGGGLCELTEDEGGGLRVTPLTFARDVYRTGDVLFSAIEDRKGYVWCAGENVLSRVDLQQGTVTNYPVRLFPVRLTFNEGDALQLQDGQLLFNTTRGLLHFHPDSLLTDGYVPVIHFDRDSVLMQPGDNSFVAHFAALDYITPEAIEYAYRLRGFEEDWHYVGSQNSATYTNLPPGSYQLEVRSTNSGGFWVDNVTSLQVRSFPTFSQTHLSHLLQLLLLVLVITLVVWGVMRLLQLKRRVRVEEQLTDMKLKFFTNVSHELRTPLTLITGPLEQLLKRGEMSGEVREQLEVVDSNARRMSKLVNQLLDFRKVQSGKMQLDVEALDLVALVREHAHDFSLLSDSMQMALHVDARVERLWLCADRDKLGQIVDNLLSNAFKYSPSGHPIEVVLDRVDGRAMLQVSDCGTGISNERLLHLFERFSSGKGSVPSGMASTGIGLSLTKELVELHHGDIAVESQLGRGSTFTVWLPLADEQAMAAGTADVQHNGQADVARVGTLPSDKATAGTALKDEATAGSLLVVEDNEQLRHFIAQLFRPTYQVHEAVNGRDGFEKARQLMPDLVISDVMMPELDGFGMAEQMHQSPELCHIPLILLTALADNDNKLQGIRAGIDDYITKPFSATLLEARVQNILQKRLLLQEYYRRHMHASIVGQKDDVDVAAWKGEEVGTTDNAPGREVAAVGRGEAVAGRDVPAVGRGEVAADLGQAGVVAFDQDFIDRVTEEIRNNLGNADYGVEQMAAALLMSRSAFGKKMRALTGQTPSDMLREVRMEHAAELLLHSNFTLAEVAYESGFNDPHYFGKCFKAHYGMTPGEYRGQGRSGLDD